MCKFSSSLIHAPGSTSHRRKRSTQKSWTSATAGWRCSSFQRTSTRSWSLRIAWSSCQGGALPTPHQSRRQIARQSDIIWPARRRERPVSDLVDRRERSTCRPGDTPPRLSSWRGPFTDEVIGTHFQPEQFIHLLFL